VRLAFPVMMIDDMSFGATFVPVLTVSVFAFWRIAISRTSTISLKDHDETGSVCLCDLLGGKARCQGLYSSTLATISPAVKALDMPLENSF
jgi:hypothetical protein